MKRALVSALLACLALPVAAQDVIVRQSVEPPTGAVIGQRVALRVDVLFHEEMSRPPRVVVPDVSGLQAFRFETQGLTVRETVAGEVYVGQRFEFALYARRGGAFEVPPVAVTLLDRNGDTTGTAQGEVTRLEINTPPGVDASQPVVAARSFTMNEAWEPDPKGSFKPGDAIVRTISRAVEDVPGLAMRDLAFVAPEGVRVYLDPPDMADQSNRGVISGRRVDRVTYVFERGGRFALPGASQPWWDLSTNSLKRANAAGATIDVAAPPASSSNDAISRRGAWLAALGLALLALLSFVAVRAFRRSRSDAARAERDAFATLRGACASGDARDVYSAFTKWRSLLGTPKRARATEIAAQLDMALFSGAAAEWNRAQSRQLLTRLAPLRTHASKDKRHEALPPLNPQRRT